MCRHEFGESVTESSLHLWSVNDDVVVSDIDGTITRSDVIGYIDTVQLGKYDYIHPGICQLYTHLHDQHKVRNTSEVDQCQAGPSKSHHAHS
jgi:phosphatidate phosphatase LPIN